MNRLITTAAFLLFSFFSIAQNKPTPAAHFGTMTEGTRMLFGDSQSKLTPAEKNSIFRQLGLGVKPDKKGFRMDGFDVGAKAYPVDLNKDGVEEVFVIMDGLLFGNTGEGVALFIRNTAHQYEQQDEVAGGIAVILDTQSGGYPDLVIAGPGFEFPKYRWNGKSYVYVGTISDEMLENTETMRVEEYWKKYKEGSGTRD